MNILMISDVYFPRVNGVSTSIATFRKSLAARLGLQDHTLFIGYLPRGPALWDCYRAGDVFIFASATETQGLVLLEAMALGVPLVSTAVMGTRDILAAGKGALVAGETRQDFAGKVIRLLQDAPLRERLGREARGYVREWSAQSQVRRLAELYLEVIADFNRA
jgi:glycosyltransferase involved in cell wall biosynthesis